MSNPADPRASSPASAPTIKPFACCGGVMVHAVECEPSKRAASPASAETSAPTDSLFRDALSAIDGILFDPDSPSLGELEESARRNPANIARCYGAIRDVVVAAFKAELAAVPASPARETPDDEVRRIAREAVDHAVAQRYDGAGMVWRAQFVAAVLKGLLPILTPGGEAKRILNRVRVDLITLADEELEEAWPK